MEILSDILFQLLTNLRHDHASMERLIDLFFFIKSDIDITAT